MVFVIKLTFLIVQQIYDILFDLCTNLKNYKPKYYLMILLFERFIMNKTG